jgi:ribosomal 30S subunit maturation factor RimM
LIEFDYFEYSARWNDPKSTYNLRKEYGIDKLKKGEHYWEDLIGLEVVNRSNFVLGKVQNLDYP